MMYGMPNKYNCEIYLYKDVKNGKIILKMGESLFIRVQRQRDRWGRGGYSLWIFIYIFMRYIKEIFGYFL